MAVVRNLMVRAGADFSGLYKEMKTANSRMGAFGKGMSTAFKGAAIGAAAVAVGTYMKDAVYKASDLNEAMSATGQVFGDAFGQIEQFAKGSATQLGQTSTEIYNAARNFGVFGNAAGLAQKENAAFSKDLVGLATDLASFYNTSVEQATTALSAGLRGESEPLRQYGVLLDEATLRQRALAMGIVSTNTQALTPQQRVLAANAEIFAQSSIAQGDWARTNMGLAGQTKIFNAQLAELKVSLGQAFLPIVTTVMPILNSFVGSLAKAASWTSEFMIALFGESKNKETNKQTKSVSKQASAYKALNKNIKDAGSAAKGSIAGFDEINALSDGKNGLSITPEVNFDEAATIEDGVNKLETVVKKIEEKSSAQKFAAKVKAFMDLYPDEKQAEKQNEFLSNYKKEFQSTSNTYPMNLSVTPQAEIKHTEGALTLNKIKEFFTRTKTNWDKVVMENGLSNIYTNVTPITNLTNEPKTTFWSKVWKFMTDNGNEINKSIKEYKLKNPFISNPINIDTTFKTSKGSVIERLGDMWDSIKKWFNDFFSTKTLSTSISANVGVGMNMVGGSAAASSSSNIANIGKNARGGIVDRPSIGMVGEAGKEMIVPLENTQFVDKLAGALGTAVMTAMQMGGGGASGGADIVIDGVALARAIQPYTSKESTRIGNSMIVAR